MLIVHFGAGDWDVCMYFGAKIKQKNIFYCENHIWQRLLSLFSPGIHYVLLSKDHLFNSQFVRKRIIREEKKTLKVWTDSICPFLRFVREKWFTEKKMLHPSFKQFWVCSKLHWNKNINISFIIEILPELKKKNISLKRRSMIHKYCMSMYEE